VPTALPGAAPGAAGEPAGRIGPNAITRVAEVLALRLEAGAGRALFEQAGLLRHWLAPPERMVDEAEVRALHRVLRDSLGPAGAADVAREAGQRTAAYLLAHRIPRPLQAVLRHTPAPWAARVLLAAIRRNAWTFVGSGRFSVQPGRPWLLRIQGNPLCAGLAATAPACDFYAATFAGLFQALVHPRAEVREVACEACGDSECRFEIHW
jgi:divinyl protochlorophyllide a 8-vinyl-reductase